MNKRNKLIIILLLIIVGIFAITTMIMVNSGELVIDNVAGVNNVTLPGENFSAGGVIPTNGYSIVHYKPLNKDIYFYDLNMSDTGYNTLINSQSTSNDDDVKNISGINGTLNYYPEAKTLVFLFEVNNKMYSIDVMFIEENQVDEAENAISILLSAWLKVSGYQQTVNYSQNDSNIKENSSNVNTNNDNNTNSNDKPTYEEFMEWAQSDEAWGPDAKDISYEDYKAYTGA